MTMIQKESTFYMIVEKTGIGDGAQLNKSCKRSYCDLGGSGEDDDDERGNMVIYPLIGCEKQE